MNVGETEQEIRNKVEELLKIRFQHSKNCQISLDKCDVATKSMTYRCTGMGLGKLK